jgi:hypothetical protein
MACSSWASCARSKKARRDAGAHERFPQLNFSLKLFTAPKKQPDATVSTAAAAQVEQQCTHVT